jgi:hypothetical protein
MSGALFNALLTADVETPAACAIVFIVGFTGTPAAPFYSKSLFDILIPAENY